MTNDLVPDFPDVTLLTHFDPDDSRYQQELTISNGPKADAREWRPETLPIAEFFARLATHKAGRKDGRAFVTGEVLGGRRNKNAVKALYAVGLDMDTGIPSATVDAALVKLNRLAIRYTTHSHWKARTEFKKDPITKWAKGAEIDDALIQRYLREEKHWEDAIVQSARYAGTEHTERGVMAMVAHDPMHKHRVVLPFKVPFVIADEGTTQQAGMDKWSKVPVALAKALGLPIDLTGVDPSRLFYYPRHAKGKPFEITITGGDLLDWRGLELDDPFEQLAREGAKGGGGDSATDEGRALARWAVTYSKRFQIVDVIRAHCDEKIRNDMGAKMEIECPFDESHSDAGDSDDRSCFAVNAGEGLGERFVVSCRHDSCRKYTNLDMLARMVRDEWFGREFLESDDCNAEIDPGDASKSKTFTTLDSPRPPLTVVADGYGGALAFNKVMEPPPKGVSYDKESGVIHQTYRNALLLIGSEGWDLGYNELTQNYGLRAEGDYPWPEHLGYALNDAIRREIRLYMLRRWGVTFKTEDIYEATMTLARRNTFNPVCDYLDEWEAKWDGTPRVERWLETYMGVKVTECTCTTPECKCGSNAAYVRAVGKIPLVAAVRRARQPGCKYDEILIAEGPQGGGKSTAVRLLAIDWFSDANLGNLRNKSAAMKLRGVWIQEIAELTALNRNETNELKEFTSQQIDRYRLPYAKSEDDFPRRCIFIGTVNPGGGAYLVDLTGNRRFWPVATGEIDLVKLAADVNQLWAEAAMMESRGDSIRLDPSLYKAAKAEQAARLADDPWVEILVTYLDGQLAIGKRRALSMTLLSDALELPKEKQTQQAMKKLKGAMALIPNWTYKPALRADGLRSAGYEYEPPPKEKPMAEEAV